MLNLSPSRKRHERDGKEDLAGVGETRTIGSGLRGHSDDQIRPLKPDDGPEMTKEYARWERTGFETHTEKNVAQSATEFKFTNSVCGAGRGGV